MLNNKEIQEKWIKYWDENKTFKTENKSDKKKFYALEMFPYPSWAWLHVWHPKWYTANDILARYKHAKWYNVLHAMWWDAFWLPAENYAIKTWVHPKETTRKNVETFKRQIKSLWFSYDWDREINTTDADYYKWTQWIFLKMFEKGLAYEQDLPINYCPNCKTWLANEEVLWDFTCERCGTKVIKKKLRQWVLWITKYADRLNDDVDRLDWPESIKSMQKNWIWRSEGCEFDLKKAISTTWKISKTGEEYEIIRVEGKESQNVMNMIEENPQFENNNFEYSSFFIAKIKWRDEIIAYWRLIDLEEIDTIDPIYVKEEYRWDSIWLKMTQILVEYSSKKEVFLDTTEDLIPYYEKIWFNSYKWENLAEIEEILNAKDDKYTVLSINKDNIESDKIRVYTTRIDTVFWVTYCVLAPDHKDIDKFIAESQRKDCEEYIENAKWKSDLDRTQLNKEKTWVFTWSYVINPFTNKKVPLYIWDYVLGSYWTWAVMAVPAHDERDNEFAKKYNLDIDRVIFSEKENKIYDELCDKIEELEDSIYNDEEEDIKTALLIDWYNWDWTSNWFPYIKNKLEQSWYIVYSPKLPNTNKPNAEENIKFLEEYANLLDENSLIITHSLWAKTLEIMLSNYDIKVDNIIMVAPVFDWFESMISPENIEILTWWDNAIKAYISEYMSYETKENIIKLSSNKQKVLLSKDDIYINFESAKNHYSSFDIIEFEDKNHFSKSAWWITKLPELLDMILSEKEVEILDLSEKATQMVYNDKVMWEKWVVFSCPGRTPEELIDIIWEDSNFAIKAFISYAEKNWFWEKKVNYKLRDWLFSRQRYWGEPIPLIHLDNKDIDSLEIISSLEEAKDDKAYIIISKDEEESLDVEYKYLVIWKQKFSKIYDGIYGKIICDYRLPLELPEVENYEPAWDWNSPLANVDDFVNIELAENLSWKRETNTMPQWWGSCWYYLRYMDNLNNDALASSEALEYWGEIDSYVWWAEHAVLHLLYARFWHKFLYDIWVVKTDEPFFRLRNQGLILWEDWEKMSKSKGNVINPDDVIEEFGADAFRMYEMYMADFKDKSPWDTKSIVWVKRFIDKVVLNALWEPTKFAEDDKKAISLMHKTIKKVWEDIENYKFNTAISAMMIMLNWWLPKDENLRKEFIENLVIMISPFAVFTAEEIWEKLWNKESIFFAKWPEYDESKIVEDSIKLWISINWKVRAQIELPVWTEKDEVIAKSKELEDIQKWIDWKEIIKEIYVPNKLVNIVIKG